MKGIWTSYLYCSARSYIMGRWAVMKAGAEDGSDVLQIVTDKHPGLHTPRGRAGNKHKS